MPSNNPPIAIIDTSVWVAAFFHKPPRRILEAWREGAFRLGCAHPIEKEYHTILTKIPPIRIQARQWLRELKNHPDVLWLDTLPEIDAHIEDPDDRKFLQCAAGLGAGVVVSLDAHLLQSTPPEGVRVVKPGEFLQSLHPQPSPQPRGFWQRLTTWITGHTDD